MMHLILLAFPLTIVMVGVICYKSHMRERGGHETNEASSEGYYFYPAPPHWTVPGAYGPYGAPSNHAAFTPQPAPYQPYHQTPRPTVEPPSFDSTINFPQQTADLLAPNGSSKFVSEKTLIRDDSSLSLSEGKLDKNTNLPSPTPRHSPSMQEEHPIGQASKLTNPFSTGLNQRDALEKLSFVTVKPDLRIPQPHLPEICPAKGYDASPASQSEGNSVIYQDLHDNSLLSEHVPHGPSLSKNAPAEDLTQTSYTNWENERAKQNTIFDQDTNEKDDTLPRYTSGDRRIFEKYHQRVSLKQDHSYIGRLDGGYRPPSTISYQVQKHTEDGSLSRNSPPPPQFEPKK